MNEAEKEREIIQICLKEIESIDKDTTSIDIKIMIGIFAFVIGIISQFVITNSIVQNLLTLEILLLIFIISFISVFWGHYQNCKYIEDCYTSLKFAIKENKLMSYKIPRINILETMFYYKRKFN